MKVGEVKVERNTPRPVPPDTTPYTTLTYPVNTYFNLGLKGYDTEWWTQWTEYGAKPSFMFDGVSGSTMFRRYLVDMIRKNVWTNHGVDAPGDWVRVLHNYSFKIGLLPMEDEMDSDQLSTLNEFSQPGSASYIPEPGRRWIDAHLCPIFQWAAPARKQSGRMCKYTLTEESSQLIGIVLQYSKREVYLSEKVPGSTNRPIEGATPVETSESSSVAKYFQAFITSVVSSEGFAVRYDQWHTDNYAWTRNPLDYVTVSYYGIDPETNERVVTGTMKFITR